MIRKIERNHIPECVRTIKDSFLAVAIELGITQKNALSCIAFSTTEENLFRQLAEERRPMFAYFHDENKIIGYYSLRVQKTKK